jgi:hypothetical protein
MPACELQYSGNSDNIGNLKDKPITVVSPPYANRVDDHGKDQPGYEGQTEKLGNYGEEEGQIGHLTDKPIAITSPPYGLGSGVGHGDNQRDSRPILKDRNVNLEYNDESKDNIGNKTQESYLDAMRLVYFEIAKVSDVLVVVTKNPTRNGQLRRLDLDTIELLKQCGWTIHCTHKALLFKEHEVSDLFGNSHKKVKGRLSFFKRLSYQKGGIVAQWEDVIFAVKGNGGGIVTMTSPPYEDALNGSGADAIRKRISEGKYVGKRPDVWTSKGNIAGSTFGDGYGQSPGQIGNLKDKLI